MSANFPLLFVALFGSLALALCYLYLYLKNRSAFLLTWSSGWGIYLLSLLFLIHSFFWTNRAGLQTAWLLSLWGSFSLLFYSIRSFLNQPVSRNDKAGLLAGAVFLAAAGLYGLEVKNGSGILPTAAWRLGTSLLLGSLLIRTGWEFRRIPDAPQAVKLTTGLAFAAWGVLFFLYPVLQTQLRLLSWWYTGTAILEFITGPGLALIYLDRNHRKLQHKNEQLEKLLGAAHQLTSSLELKGVLENIGRGAYEILNAYSCTIYLLSDDGLRLTPVVAIDPEYEEEILAAELEVGSSLTGQSILNRRSLVFNDPYNSPSKFQIPGTPVENEERLIVAPFLDGERALGAMCIARMGVQYGPEDLALAETFAAYAGTALKNARTHLDLLREVHERLKAVQALRESESRYRDLFADSPISLWETDLSLIQEQIETLQKAGVVDLKAYYDEHPEEAIDLLKRVIVLGVNHATMDLLGIENLEALEGYPGYIFTDGLVEAIKNSLTALTKGKTYFECETLTRNFNGEPLYISLKWKTAPGYETTYGRVLVSILDITEQKMAQAAIEQKVYQRQRLLDTARHLAESLDVHEVLERIGAGARELVAADGCTIYVLTEDGQALNPMVVVDPFYSAQILASPLQVEGSLTGQAVLQRRGVIFNDAVNSGFGIQIPGTPVDEQENIIVAPFMVDGEVLGAMCMDRTGSSFTPEDLDLAMTFAAYASTALKNARSHTQLGEANEALQREIVERQQTELALRNAHTALAEGEERYRTLFQDSPISLWDEDFSTVKNWLDELRQTGVSDFRLYFDQHPEELKKVVYMIRVVAVNRATMALFEAPNEESLLSDLSQITIDESFTGMKESILAVAAGAKQFEFETVNRTLTGKRIEISLRWTVAPGCEESYEKLLLSIIDITERRRAHAALKASESRFRSLFEDSPVSLWEEDFSGVKDFLNQICQQEGFPTPAVEELRQYFLTQPRELYRCYDQIHVLDVNPTTLKLYHASDQNDLDKNLSRILNKNSKNSDEIQINEILAIAAGAKEFELETRNLTTDGEPIWVALKWSVAPGFEDSYAKVMVSVLDITARKQAEEAMHHAHAALAEANQALERKTNTLEHLLETARQLTSSLDVKQVLESIGRGALEILEAYGCSIFMLDESGRWLHPVVVIDPEYTEETLAVIMDVDASLTGQAVKQRRSLIFNDPLRNPSTYQIPGTPVDTEERITVAPFVDGNQVIGAMCISRMGINFTNEDLALVETFAAYASSALRNARAHANLSEAHNALQESEERYRSLFEDNQSVMMLIDPIHMEIVDANPSACRFYGYERQELVNRRLTEIPIIDETEAARTIMGSTNGRGRQFLSAHRLARGEIHPVEVYFSIIRMDGKALQLAIVHDITQRIQRERELETIVTVASALRSAQTRAEMLPVILQQVSELLQAEGAALAMVDAHSGDTRFELGIGTEAEFTGSAVIAAVLSDAAALSNSASLSGTAAPASASQWNDAAARNKETVHPGLAEFNTSATHHIASEVISTGQPYLKNEFPLSRPDQNPESSKVEHPAVAAVPLIAQDQTIGALTIERSAPITDADMRLLNAVGEMAANAIYRETLNEETQQYAANMGAVSAIGRSLAETLELEQVYERLAESTLDLFPHIAAVLISRFDPDRACSIPEYGVEDGTKMDVTALPVILLDQADTSAQSKVIRSRQPCIVADLQPEERNLPGQRGSALFVPLLAKGEILGLIELRSSLTNTFTSKEADLLTVIGQIGAIAIQNARLFQEIQRRVNRLNAQHSIDKAITGSFDLDVTLALVVEQMTRQLGVDAGDVLLFDPLTQDLCYAAGAGFRTNGLNPTSLHLGKGLAGRAALDRKMISVKDLEKQLEELRDYSAGDPTIRATVSDLQAEGFLAYFGIPLIAKGQIKGVLELYKRSSFKPDGEWLSFLDALAYQSAIAIDNATLFNDLQHSNRELTLTIDTTLEGWAQALELRDLETKNHSQRVVEETVRVARAMGLGGDALMHLRRGALLHDIGKMGIPDQILNKPGPLTTEEWEVMKQHPIHAFKLLSSIPFLRPAMDIPYGHHERWDGSGYPRGLKGEEIPLAARIFAVVDVWDALLNDRPYRPPWPEEKVREYLQEQAGKQFDLRVVQAFLNQK